MIRMLVCFIALAFTSILFISSAFAGITASPSTVNVSRGAGSVVSIVYQVNVPFSLAVPSAIPSSGGTFSVGGVVIGTNPTPLNIPVNRIPPGTGPVLIGNTSETINIPVRIVETAIKRGTNTITYTRRFMVTPATPADVSVTLVVTSGSVGTFDVKSMNLYFENRRPEITIERHFPKLKAYADISFNGSGLLEGYWEVDGRIHTRVFQHLTFGQTVTLVTPEIPSLPTFDPGTHIIKLVITRPSAQIPLPAIVYFVTPQEFRVPVNLPLTAPEDGSQVPYAAQTFRWQPFGVKSLYLVQFCEFPDTKCIFSAYTYDAAYTLPELALKQLFMPGTTYTWQVKGFDAEQNLIGESRQWQFRFTKPAEKTD